MLVARRELVLDHGRVFIERPPKAPANPPRARSDLVANSNDVPI
jgi:hypothetical protein